MTNMGAEVATQTTKSFKTEKTDKVISKIREYGQCDGWKTECGEWNAGWKKGTNSISHPIKWLLSSDTAPGVLTFSLRVKFLLLLLFWLYIVVVVIFLVVLLCFVVVIVRFQTCVPQECHFWPQFS